MWKNKQKVILPVLIGLAGCTSTPSVQISVYNPSELLQNEAIVEVRKNWLEKLRLRNGEQFVVRAADGTQIPNQVTHDSLLIFPVSVAAGSTVSYSISKGVPIPFDTICCGQQYPERLDDIAWENDKAAYRTYGPALQQKGEKAYGYDVFTKSVNEPVVEERYRRELNSMVWATIDSLHQAGNTIAADSVIHTISYHVDHGNGMDCYSVGSTLGGGTAALMPDSSIVYPYCYQRFEILDNGPLRFTVRLTFPPSVVKEDTAVVETRMISLDKGSHLNRTIIRYEHLSAPYPVATGIVIHPQHSDGYIFDSSKRYIAYADSTDNPSNGNGVIYLGAVFPNQAEEVRVQWFPQKEQHERSGALGHILGISRYEPGSSYIYYWGSGWSKAGIKNEKAWETYLREYAYLLDHPLQVTVK